MARIHVLTPDRRKALTPAQRDHYNDARFDAYILGVARADIVAAMGTVRDLGRADLAKQLGRVIKALDEDPDLFRF